MADYEGSLRFRSDSREVEGSTRDLERLEKQSGRTERAADRFGRTVRRVFAGLSLGLIARQFIRNTIEQEQATAKLNQVLRATGRFSEETSQALLNHASALQRVTTFGDEAIITAQSQLLTFKNLGDKVFPRATEAVLDLSTVMDQDLKSSAIQLGKALNDPVLGMTALSRVGVQFTEQQRDLAKELVRTGRILEAQEIILGEVEGQMGGTARAARDTFGGALAGLRNAIGDLLEGDTSSGGLKGATKAFNDLTDALSDPEVQQGFDAVASGIGRVLEAAARAPQILGFFGKSIKVAFGAFDDADLRARELELGQLQLRIEALQAVADVSGANPFAPVIRRRLDALREELELKRQLLLADQTAPGRTPSGALPSTIPGLDVDPLQPIVVNAERRKAQYALIGDEFVLISERIKAQLTRGADEGLQGILDAQAATLGGPLVDAAQKYNETLSMLAEQEANFAKAGSLTVDRQRELTLARERAIQVLNQEVEAIREEEAALAAVLTPAQQLIQDIQFENELMTLGNLEREQAIALRYAGAKATEAEIAAIRELIRINHEAREAAAGLDEFRATLVGGFVDAARDIRNVGDAVERLGERIQDIILRKLGDKLVESLFGAFGTSQAGGSSQGGFFASLATALFGSGRAHGGPVYPGRIHPVGEREPELLAVGNRRYLIPGPEGGTVQPITNNNSNSQRTTVNVHYTKPISRETAVQVANEIGRETRLSMARNR